MKVLDLRDSVDVPNKNKHHLLQPSLNCPLRWIICARQVNVGQSHISSLTK